MEYFDGTGIGIVRSEIGGEATEFVSNLIDWLGVRPSFDRTRIAPSIITRAEAEIFSIPSPRFARRVYLNGGGLMNLRRLELFSSSTRETYASTISPFRYLFRSREVSHQEITKSIVGHICIADSLIPVPKKFSHYKVLACKLTKCYGESIEVGEPDQQLVPFLQHIELGGLCAQACCFMALCLCEREARSILGLTEITAHLTPDLYDRDDWAGEIELTGMNCPQIASFFNNRRIGLNATCQSDKTWGEGQDSAVAFAIRSYIHSACPVIAAVDAGRMAGQGEGAPSPNVFESNGTHFRVDEKKRSPIERQNHAVIIVGADEKDNFLVNDPSTYPFLKISIADLRACRRYESDADDQEGSRSRSADNGLSADKQLVLDPLEVIPIVPREVKLALLDPRTNVRDRFRRSMSATVSRGLLSIIADMQSPVGRDTGSDWPSDVPEIAGDFFSDTELRLVNTRDPDTYAGLSDDYGSVIEQVKFAGWVWVHRIKRADQQSRFAETMWIWNAELENIYPPWKYLVAVAGQRDGQWEIIHEFFHRNTRSKKQPEPEQDEDNKNGRAASPLKGAIISSCDVDKPDNERLAAFQHDQYTTKIKPPACEFYFLMQSDIARFPAHVSKSKANAVEFLAFMDNRHLGEVAKYVSDMVPAKSIVALASFVPGVSANRWSRRARVSAKCIRNLVAIAAELQELDHPVSTIELVAGSRAKGLRRNIKSNHFTVRMNKGPSLMNNLIANLSRALASSRIRATKSPLALALEVEPGPYFLLRDQRSLVSLARQISKSDVGRYVGFNLDIAHWRLANILPDVLKQSVVRNRIVHAHLAGHHPAGHFGDMLPLAVNTPDDFEPWLSHLRSIANEPRTNELPNFSGYVSLEIEAAKSDDYVRLGYEQMLSLL